jgi:hypothetical protein
LRWFSLSSIEGHRHEIVVSKNADEIHDTPLTKFSHCCVKSGIRYIFVAIELDNVHNLSHFQDDGFFCNKEGVPDE